MSDKTTLSTTLAPYVFNLSTNSQYNNTEFKGLLSDSGASTQSTGGIGQLKSLQQLDISIQIDKNITRSANFIFKIVGATSIKSINLNILLELVTFHIIPVNTPFLLYLADMDKLGAFFNNITNEIIQSQMQLAQYHPVIRRYGHAFLLWYMYVYTLVAESFAQNPCYLMDVELRRLYCHFKHSLVYRLYQLLERSGHNIEL